MPTRATLKTSRPRQAKGPIVVNWNGTDVPAEMRDLPAGQYLVAPTDQAYELTPDEEAGIEWALASYQAGRLVSAKKARVLIDAVVKR